MFRFFIFCIRNLHFAWKWQLIFSFFGHFDQKPKTEKWNELNIRLTVITNSLFSLKTIEQMTHKYNAYNKSRKYVSQYQIKISQAIFGTKWGFTYLKAYLVSTPPVGMFCWYCYKELVVDSGSTHSYFFLCQGYSSGINWRLPGHHYASQGRRNCTKRNNPESTN